MQDRYETIQRLEEQNKSKRKQWLELKVCQLSFRKTIQVDIKNVYSEVANRLGMVYQWGSPAIFLFVCVCYKCRFL